MVATFGNLYAVGSKGGDRLPLDLNALPCSPNMRAC